MASTITFNNLTNGQEVSVLPFEVSGTITVQGGANLVAAARQIDDNPLQDLADGCSPAPSTPGPSNFATEITATDCPLPNTYYMLTIYCWDDGDAAVSVASVTFKTSAGGGVGDPGLKVATPPTPPPPG